MTVEVIMPHLGAVEESSTLLKWRVTAGEVVKPGQVLFEAESDKAMVEIEAAVGGQITQLLCKEGEVITAGTVIALIQDRKDENEKPEATSINPDQESRNPSFRGQDPGEGRRKVRDALSSTESSEGRLVATPLARKIARLEGIKLSAIKGSGPRGRIVEADVKKALEMQQISNAENYLLGMTLPSLDGLSKARRTIAQRMLTSTLTTARVTLTTELVVDGLVAQRKQYQAHLGARGEIISYDVLIVMCVAKALQEAPSLNASLSDEGIQYHDDVNIGVAVDTERGLLVPVLRNVPGRSLIDLANDLQGLIERARSGKSKSDDFGGATFTITNLGMYGIDAFTPIINLPECAILGIGRITQKPIEKDSELALGYVMTLSLAFDHRLVDGAPAARFLQRAAELIANPNLLLLG